jgi:ribosomal protein S18 acetylase RimI-like enzyme
MSSHQEDHRHTNSNGTTNGNTNGNGKKKIPVEIREMEIDDLAPVFHMGETLFTAQKSPNLYRTWDEYEVTHFFQLDPELCLVAELDDKIVGFVLGTVIEKNRSAWKYGYLVWLGIDPASQKYGVGTKLFQELRSRMEDDGVRMMLVDTQGDNTAALSFFEKMGFGNPEEHIFLSFNLSEEKNKQNARAKNKRSGNMVRSKENKRITPGIRFDKTGGGNYDGPNQTNH